MELDGKEEPGGCGDIVARSRVVHFLVIEGLFSTPLIATRASSHLEEGVSCGGDEYAVEGQVRLCSTARANEAI